MSGVSVSWVTVLRMTAATLPDRSMITVHGSAVDTSAKRSATLPFGSNRLGYVVWSDSNDLAASFSSLLFTPTKVTPLAADPRDPDGKAPSYDDYHRRMVELAERPVTFQVLRKDQPTGDKPTEITVTGIDKQQVGQVAAEIREYRGPEPYKGKGVRYAGEKIVRKEGKKK